MIEWPKNRDPRLNNGRLVKGRENFNPQTFLKISDLKGITTVVPTGLFNAKGVNFSQFSDDEKDSKGRTEKDKGEGVFTTIKPKTIESDLDHDESLNMENSNSSNVVPIDLKNEKSHLSEAQMKKLSLMHNTDNILMNNKLKSGRTTENLGPLLQNKQDLTQNLKVERVPLQETDQQSQGVPLRSVDFSSKGEVLTYGEDRVCRMVCRGAHFIKLRSSPVMKGFLDIKVLDDLGVIILEEETFDLVKLDSQNIEVKRLKGEPSKSYGKLKNNLKINCSHRFFARIQSSIFGSMADCL